MDNLQQILTGKSQMTGLHSSPQQKNIEYLRRPQFIGCPRTVNDGQMLRMLPQVAHDRRSIIYRISDHRTDWENRMAADDNRSSLFQKGKLTNRLGRLKPYNEIRPASSDQR